MPSNCSAGARRSNQPILKEINPEYSLEGLMLKLKFQYLVIWCKQTTHWKVPDAGKDWGQKEKRMSEDEMAGQHQWCNEHELGETPGDGEGQGGLACCNPWGRKDLGTTRWLNNNNGIMRWWGWWEFDLVEDSGNKGKGGKVLLLPILSVKNGRKDGKGSWF